LHLVGLLELLKHDALSHKHKSLLHVSSNVMLIIRRSNFINAASGNVTVCKWPSRCIGRPLTERCQLLFMSLDPHCKYRIHWPISTKFLRDVIPVNVKPSDIYYNLRPENKSSATYCSILYWFAQIFQNSWPHTWGAKTYYTVGPQIWDSKVYNSVAQATWPS